VRSFPLALQLLLALPACTVPELVLEGRPCSPGEPCARGLTCDPATSRCVPCGLDLAAERPGDAGTGEASDGRDLDGAVDRALSDAPPLDTPKTDVPKTDAPKQTDLKWGSPNTRVGNESKPRA